jgi:hypothetical protein
MTWLSCTTQQNCHHFLPLMSLLRVQFVSQIIFIETKQQVKNNFRLSFRYSLIFFDWIMTSERTDRQQCEHYRTYSSVSIILYKSFWISYLGFWTSLLSILLIFLEYNNISSLLWYFEQDLSFYNIVSFSYLHPLQFILSWRKRRISNSISLWLVPTCVSFPNYW